MKQPEPLRLAEQLEMSATNADMGRRPSRTDTRRLAASELRRLHEVNQELLEALKEAEPMLQAMLEHIKAHLGDNYKMPTLGRVRAALASAKEQS